MDSLADAVPAAAQGAHESPLTKEESLAIRNATWKSMPSDIALSFRQSPTQPVLELGLRSYNILGNNRYMGWGPDMLPYIKEEGRLDKISPADIHVGFTEMRMAIREGRLTGCHDIAIAYPDGCWSITASSMDVVIEGVSAAALQSIRSGKDTHARQLGKDFCRIGLPRKYFEKIFSSIALGSAGYAVFWDSTAAWKSMQLTPRYFWIDASWGSATVPMTFKYLEQGESKIIQDKVDVHDMLGGSSVIGLCEMQLHRIHDLATSKHDTCFLKDTDRFSVTLHSFARECIGDKGPARTTSSAALPMSQSEMVVFNKFKPPAKQDASKKRGRQAVE
jgi:hypothetical protein